MRAKSTRTKPTAAAGAGARVSAEADGGAAGAADIAQASGFVVGQVARGGAKGVVEGVARAERRLELGGRADRAQPAAMHERDPLAELVGLVHVVRREQDRHAALLAQPGDEVPHRAARDRVEADRRLVEDQHARPVDERLRQLEPADHAGGVRRHEAGGGLEHAGRLEREVDAVGALRARDVEQPGERHHVLAARQRAVGGELLRHVADLPAHGHPLAGDVVAEDVRDAATDRQERRQDADRRRLAGAVGTEQPEHLALLDLEVDAVHGALLAEGGDESLAAGGRRRVGHATRSSVSSSRSRAGTDARSAATSSGSRPASAAASSRSRSPRKRRSRVVAAAVSSRRAARRSPGSGWRSSSPCPTRWPTSVLTVFGARWSAAAASPTPIPGWASTSRSSSPWAPVSGSPPTTSRAPRRSRRRTPPHAAARSAARVSSSAAGIGAGVYLCNRAIAIVTG